MYPHAIVKNKMAASMTARSHPRWLLLFLHRMQAVGMMSPNPKPLPASTIIPP